MINVKKLWEKKEYLAFFIVIALFVFVSVTSISSIRLLQGNARVVNYVGIVRGATQKLIKEEIMGWDISQGDPLFAQTSDWYPDDKLVARLDSIVNELLTGVGPNDLVVLRDEAYLSNMRQVKAHWTALKELIGKVRAGGDPSELFDSSQAYFELVNKTVFSAESYSEAQVNHINSILLFVNGIFILLIVSGLILYVRGLAVKRRAETLSKIAYIDPLTFLGNRASCERLIERFKAPPVDVNLAVFMFDMNDLKLTNDFLGHQGGDKVIAAFATVLKAAASKYGFVGRFGGDEFLALFEEGTEAMAEDFVRMVREGTDAYNEKQENKLEMIHYAVGYVIANPRKQDIEDIIHEADNRMYANKRKLKAARQNPTLPA